MWNPVNSNARQIGLSIGILVLAVISLAMQPSRGSWWLAVFTITLTDAYLMALLLAAAAHGPAASVWPWKSIRAKVPILDRHYALFVLPLLFGALVLAFSSLYLKTGAVCSERSDGVCKSGTTLAGVPDAIYFSLVTIATVGYGDFAPTGQWAKWTAAGEILNGALLLLAAFPILASRLALFDSGNSPETIIGVRRLENNQWEVQQDGNPVPAKSVSDRLEIVLTAKSDVKVSASTK